MPVGARQTDSVVQPCAPAAIVAVVPDYQRIHVVSTAATEPELRRLGAAMGRQPVVLAAPTADAARVVRSLGVEPRVETLLAAQRHPVVDRGDRVDALVREHALSDRFRDVVVVTDPATATLLLRVLAPDQLDTPGAVTVVGLVRAGRPSDVRRAVVLGVVLGVAIGLAQRLGVILVLPAVAAVTGGALMTAPAWRHVGRELVLAAGIAIVVGLAVIAGSSRFPAGW